MWQGSDFSQLPRTFYARLQGQVRVGIEATGHTRWFSVGVLQATLNQFACLRVQHRDLLVACM